MAAGREGQVYLRDLQQNGMRLYPTNPSTELALQTHQIDLAVTQSSAAYALAGHDPAFTVVLPPKPAILPSVTRHRRQSAGRATRRGRSLYPLRDVAERANPAHGEPFLGRHVLAGHHR